MNNTTLLYHDATTDRPSRCLWRIEAVRSSSTTLQQCICTTSINCSTKAKTSGPVRIGTSKSTSGSESITSRCRIRLDIQRDPANHWLDSTKGTFKSIRRPSPRHSNSIHAILQYQQKHSNNNTSCRPILDNRHRHPDCISSRSLLPQPFPLPGRTQHFPSTIRSTLCATEVYA